MLQAFALRPTHETPEFPAAIVTGQDGKEAMRIRPHNECYESNKPTGSESTTPQRRFHKQAAPLLQGSP